MTCRNPGCRAKTLLPPAVAEIIDGARALDNRGASCPAEAACSGFVCEQPAVAVDVERGICLGEELPEQNLV